MREVLISIQPKWCELIANGKKTIEVRKTLPKLETPFKCYIYCLKGGEKIAQFDFVEGTFYKVYNKNTHWSNGCSANIHEDGNGKVIGEFICDRIFQYTTTNIKKCCTITNSEIEKGSCLTHEELFRYECCGEKEDRLFDRFEVFAWHISELKIYDNPKELSEFKEPCIFPKQPYCPSCSVGYEYISETEAEFYRVDGRCETEWICNNYLKRPPQSWCYIEYAEEKK